MTDTKVEVPNYASMPEIPDPYALFYVVNDSRDEEGNIASEKDILQASTNALLQVLNSEDEQVIVLVKEWTSGPIRKIAKRARAAAWNKVLALDTTRFMGEHNGVQVIAFAPMRLSTQPRDLKKLQVTGLNSTDSSSADIENESHLLVRVNETLNMSTGKVVAQVGHAVQLFLMYGKQEETAHWLENGSRLKVIRTENVLKSETTAIIVHDAGYTEVPSGSMTATAEYRFELEGK